MKSALIKITVVALSVSIIASGVYVAIPTEKAEAQAKATACAAGYIAAGLSALAAIPQNIIGVPKSQAGDTAQNVTTGGSANALSFNSCVLEPLAKIMIIAIIRNVGASVVNWVNSGFNGKPLFVTDLGGTLLDAADQTAGQFIEGSELGFLCKDFSFQIRLALALKYSQPFQQRATCTLSQVADNAHDFTNSNGYAGWDNWLQVTTEPQNNVYGAYVIASDELSQRMAKAVNITDSKIALGQGFLDFETCDQYETKAQVAQRLNSGGNFQAQPTGSGVLNKSSAGYQVPGSSFGSISSMTSKPGSGVLKSTSPSSPSAASQFESSIDSKPRCIASSTKTPGTIIAGKLKSQFAQGDIQAAVAQEIDDVIAATMNQLAQKMMQGAGGLLGLSHKSSASSESYYDRYQSQYYGSSAAATTAQIGATSPAEDYTVGSYSAVQNLLQNDPQVQQINDTTNSTADQAIKQDQARQQALNASLGANTTEENFALLKTTSESSQGDGLAANAVNGVTDGNIDQYNKAAVTGEEQNPWWKVDLGHVKPVKEVRIWRVTNEPVSQTLEKIRVVATDGSDQNAWTSDYIEPTESSPNPIVVPVGKSVRYIKIEKQGTLDDQCRVVAGVGSDITYESCYRPLKLVEVEAMGEVAAPSSLGGASANDQTTPDDMPATSTVSWIVSNPAGTVTSSSPLLYELRLTAKKSVSGIQISSTLLKDGVAVPFQSVFSSTDFTYGTLGGQTATYSISSPTDGTILLDNVAVSAGGYYVFKQSSAESPNASPGTYTIETDASDNAGNLIASQTTDVIVR